MHKCYLKCVLLAFLCWGVLLAMTARNMPPTCWAVVVDHFHGFGIGEADWFFDGFPTVRAPLRALTPVAIVERPKAYRAACPAILRSRTRHGRTTAMSGIVGGGVGVGRAHVGVCVVAFGRELFRRSMARSAMCRLTVGLISSSSASRAATSRAAVDISRTDFARALSAS